MIENFNPRFPCGKRLKSGLYTENLVFISIHASLAGSDALLGKASYVIGDFNPRFPCGKRRTIVLRGGSTVEFQSTLPLREATLAATDVKTAIDISIHASLAGSD